MRPIVALLLVAAAVGGADVGGGAKESPPAAAAAEHRFSEQLVSEQLVALRAPLTTVVPATTAVAGPIRLEADVEVPADAPSDLGVGAFIANPDGRWYQRCAGALKRGHNHVSFHLAPDESLVGEGHEAAWNAAEAAESRQAGLFFYSAQASHAAIVVRALTTTASKAAREPHALVDLAFAHSGRTGERWTLTCRPQPLPADPYDPSEFALDAVITTPSGDQLRIPGFYEQPMRSVDRGDREDVRPEAAAHFALRFRPRAPGTYRVRLEARWRIATVSVSLPPLVVEGVPWDGYARVDREDPRFFSAGGRFLWPVGINLRSIYDLRGHECLGSAVTPDRGTLSYAAYLARFAASGVDLVEIWMSAWNLALEWRAGWPGYAGIGRYNQANAWRLDQVLDTAWKHGMRVNLVINNHGQGSPKPDREWPNNPWNAALGGPLADPAGLFDDAKALAGQERLRRYIIARYADHPAIMGWKLWSEVNLTAGRGEPLRAWHEQAAARWHALDVYGHGVTTHWAGDYHTPDRAILALPGIDYVCIDAYHNNRRQQGNRPVSTIVDLVSDSINDAGRGLGAFAKPIIITEFGGTSQACPQPQLIAEQSCGLWAGLVSGVSASPMLWWFEWVDQGNRWRPYQAIRRFVAGEDLRAKTAHSVSIAATTSNSPRLRARGWWAEPRLIGYVVDLTWAVDGLFALPQTDAQLRVDDLEAGEWHVEWWDPDLGCRVADADAAHGGGALILACPTFARHLAFKLWREEHAHEASAASDMP